VAVPEEGDNTMTAEMKCSVCDCDFDIESEGGIEGFFGILPVSFCPTCYSCMCDMADQANFEERDAYERGVIDGMQKQMQSSVDKAVNAMSKREWVGLTDEEIDGLVANTRWHELIKATEAKLKEKNT
jgi:hypothetical protein